MNDGDDPIIGGFQPTIPTGEPPATPDGDDRAVLIRLKETLAATVPGLDASLVQGETLAEIEQSFAALRALAATVAHPVPAGAPQRLAAPPTTPFEKIREGLAHLAG